MSSLSQSYSEQIRLQRNSWIYSMIFHAIVGSCILVLVSNFRMPLEPEQSTWNVELVESPKIPTAVDTFSEAKPDAKPAPHKPQAVESRPMPSQPVLKSVPQVAPSLENEVVQPFSQVTTVNQTASTIVTESLQHSEPIKTIEPITAAEPMMEEQAAPTTNVAPHQEIAPPVVPTPLINQHTVEPVAKFAETDAFAESTTHPQQPAAEQTAAQAAPTTKADYGWLVKALLGRIDQLKNYPHMARINHWEGKVILRAVIRNDGQVLMVAVHESSGRPILDNDAMETLRRASPLKLEQPLGKPQVAILMPISYALRQ